MEKHICKSLNICWSWHMHLQTILRHYSLHSCAASRLHLACCLFFPHISPCSCPLSGDGFSDGAPVGALHPHMVPTRTKWGGFPSLLSSDLLHYQNIPSRISPPPRKSSVFLGPSERCPRCPSSFHFTLLVTWLQVRSTSRCWSLGCRLLETDMSGESQRHCVGIGWKSEELVIESGSPHFISKCCALFPLLQ